MAKSYRRSKSYGGVKITSGRKSGSISIGGKAGRVTVNSKGRITTTVKTPVKGLSYSTTSSTSKKKTSSSSRKTDDFDDLYDYSGLENITIDLSKKQQKKPPQLPKPKLKLGGWFWFFIFMATGCLMGNYGGTVLFGALAIWRYLVANAKLKKEKEAIESRKEMSSVTE